MAREASSRALSDAGMDLGGKPGLRDIDQVALLTSGVGILVLLNFLPGGLAEGMYRLRDRWLRQVARRNRVHVPSLLEDSQIHGDEAMPTEHPRPATHPAPVEVA